MTDPRTRTLQELLLLSDFGRANPERVRELLELCEDNTVSEQRERELDTAA